MHINGRDTLGSLQLDVTRENIPRQMCWREILKEMRRCFGDSFKGFLLVMLLGVGQGCSIEKKKDKGLKDTLEGIVSFGDHC